LTITIILAPHIGILPRLGFTVAAFLAAASFLPLIGRKPLRTPLSTWGMVVAHFGLAVALTGMAANAAFTSERLAIAKPGEILTVGPWQVQLEDVTPTAGKNYTALEAELRATRGEDVIALNPQTHYYRTRRRRPMSPPSAPSGTASCTPCSAAPIRRAVGS
jgi:Cytochrome c biogenesis factor